MLSPDIEFEQAHLKHGITARQQTIWKKGSMCQRSRDARVVSADPCESKIRSEANRLLRSKRIVQNQGEESKSFLRRRTCFKPLATQDWLRENVQTGA